MTPPCPVAGPGLCGGCDFQHVDLAHQRTLKADVVREQLVRIGGLPAEHPLVAGLEVEHVPGDLHGLRWRTRSRFVPLADGRLGMRKHRSHELVPVEDCLISTDQAPPREVRGHRFSVADDGFWQVHPGAATALVDCVVEMLGPRPGESVLDLYAGVGLFARCLADLVGPDAAITAVEVDLAAVQHAGINLAGLPRASVHQGTVDEVLTRLPQDPVDLVVLDPPREGARRPVVEAVVARAPRAIAHVACDPAALARDTAVFVEHGYVLSGLRGFDLFPMTHHVECVALLTKTGSDLR